VSKQKICEEAMFTHVEVMSFSRRAGFHALKEAID
jgi:hypothetical protein